ncbi:Replication-relaxation [Thermoanaerobacter thermohydrosulfuricus]|nr:Replication-relaxation [Thermoanaerobacter thermohydrosulfuricus]
MQLTKRDLEILYWINRMRYVTVNQVAKKFKIGIWYTYKRLKKLCDDEYLYSLRIFRNKPGVYICTKKGAEIAGSNLWAPKHYVNLANYEHDLKVVDLSIELERQGEWISMRELRQDSRTDMIPDGVLIKDGKKIAVEVELTKKSERNLKKKMNYYKRSIDYDEIWYFVSSRVVYDAVEKAAKEMDYLKVFYLSEVLKDERERTYASR